MPVITLTTEWSVNDYYLGALKGALLSKIPDCKIIDITHNIKSFNIIQAAFILKSCYKQFPTGSIHIICVNSEETEKNKLVAVKHNNHYFICSDNGILGLLFETKPDRVIKLTKNEVHSTFPELNIFPDAVSRLIIEKNIDSLGKNQDRINRQIGYLPIVDKLDDDIVLTGKVIYIDSYENAITNISKNYFYQIGKARSFIIYPQSNYYSIKKINTGYFETEDGELLAIFNSLNLLEIAIKNGSAKELLKLDVNSQIRIKFS